MKVVQGWQGTGAAAVTATAGFTQSVGQISQRDASRLSVHIQHICGRHTMQYRVCGSLHNHGEVHHTGEVFHAMQSCGTCQKQPITPMCLDMPTLPYAPSSLRGLTFVTSQ